MNLYHVLLFLLPISVLANTFTVELENDVLYKSDKYYTHGTRFTYEVDGVYWSLGQNIYTPSDIKVDTIATNDRPYSGTIYLSLSGIRQLGNLESKYIKRNIYNQLEVFVGISGKYSGAEQTQKLIHDLIHSTEPKGWDNQTKTRPFLLLSDRIYGDIISTKYLNSSIYFGMDLGTPFINAGCGAKLMIGYNVPRHLNAPIISKLKNFSVYSFFDIYEKRVFVNKLLYSDNTDITPTHNVQDIRVGIGICYNMFEIRYTQCTRGKEFIEQENNVHFGSILLKFPI